MKVDRIRPHSLPPRRSSTRALAVVAGVVLTSICIGATSAYVWDRVNGVGDVASARRAAWIGSDKERRQAMTEMHAEARQTVESLQQLATTGPESTRIHAVALLEHLKRQLGD